MDIKYHWVRELVTDKKLAIYTIDSIDNPADIFTKILPPITFQKHIKQINLEFKKSKDEPVPKNGSDLRGSVELLRHNTM